VIPAPQRILLCEGDRLGELGLTQKDRIGDDRLQLLFCASLVAAASMRSIRSSIAAGATRRCLILRCICAQRNSSKYKGKLTAAPAKSHEKTAAHWVTFLCFRLDMGRTVPSGSGGDDLLSV
jgi:hypothetical protein